ncbi:MAG: hypothetical protein ACTSPK_14350 [Candidatus Heimdallarchaeota archaeon]
MTEVEKVNQKIPGIRLEKVFICFDIINVVLGLIAVFVVMIFPVIYWGQLGMVPIVFDFSNQYNPDWFDIDIRILISLLSLCVVLAFLSIFLYLGKFSFLRSKLVFSPLGILISCAIIVLTVLMKNALVEYSVLVNPSYRVFLGGAYYFPLIYASFLIQISIAQFVLFFLNKSSTV